MANTRTRTATPATGGVAMYAHRALLVASGFNSKMDSDGTTYSSTGSRLTNGGSGPKGLANNGAWFRLQATAGGPFEWCIQRGTDNTQWRVKSANAAFTGGTPGAITVPSAAGEVVLLGGGSDAVPTFATLFPTDATYLIDSIIQDAAGPPVNAYNNAMLVYTFAGLGEVYSILAKTDAAFPFTAATVLCAVGPVWLASLNTPLVNTAGVGPSLSWVSPTPGTVIRHNDPLIVQITTVPGGSFAGLVLIVEYPSGIWETIHDNTGFSGQYSAGSARAGITNGYQFTIVREGGWPQTPTIRCVAVDTSGNVNA